MQSREEFQEPNDLKMANDDRRLSLTKTQGKRGDFFRIEGKLSKSQVERRRESLFKVIEYEMSFDPSTVDDTAKNGSSKSIEYEISFDPSTLDDTAKNGSSKRTEYEMSFDPSTMDDTAKNGSPTRGSLATSPGVRGFRTHRGKSNFFLDQCRESLRQITSPKTKKEKVKGSLRKLMSFVPALPLEAAPPLPDFDEESSSMSEEFEIDIEEQRTLMQQCEERKAASECNKMNRNTNQIIDSTSRNATSAERTNNHDMIDLAPGVQLPLRNSAETWQAIIEGRLVGTMCCCCLKELTCIEDAEYLACADCWVFSRIRKSNSFVVGGQKYSSYGVCIGVTPEDIAQWLVQEE